MKQCVCGEKHNLKRHIEKYAGDARHEIIVLKWKCADKFLKQNPKYKAYLRT